MAIPYTPGEPLTCQQIRELDILAIEHVGIPGIILMENAARSLAEFIYSTLIDPTQTTALFLCGPGNNGGDGLVAARHLRNAGVNVLVALAAANDRYKGDAATNLAIYERLEEPMLDALTPQGLKVVKAAAERSDVIIDGLLGTGATGAPRGVIGDLIRIANAATNARRIAIDLPSGLDADAGEPHDPCFRADATVTFVAEKVGFDKPAARAVLGRVVVADIGAPHELIPGRKEISKRG